MIVLHLTCVVGENWNCLSIVYPRNSIYIDISNQNFVHLMSTLGSLVLVLWPFHLMLNFINNQMFELQGTLIEHAHKSNCISFTQEFVLLITRDGNYSLLPPTYFRLNSNCNWVVNFYSLSSFLWNMFDSLHINCINIHLFMFLKMSTNNLGK